jgi:GWxTD domain-containing protein
MKSLLIALSCLIISTVNPLQIYANDKDIVPFFSFATFYSHEQGSYIETYLSILGKSVYFTNISEHVYQAQLEVTYLIKSGDNIVDFKKYVLHSPEVNDTSDVAFTIVDLQRFAIPNGQYEIELKLIDLHSPYGAIVIEEAFSLDYTADAVSVSGLQLIERYSKTEEINPLSKSGYDLVPLPINFYPQNIHSLTFYVEIYNTLLLGEDEPILIKSYIQQYETKQPASNLLHFKRVQSKAVSIYMHEFNIEQLRSGNYFLVVEVRDKNNELLTTNQLFFQRSNQSADTFDLLADIPKQSFAYNFKSKTILSDNIRSLRPIASEFEKNFIDKNFLNEDIETLQRFFYVFWIERDAHNPEQSWKKYEQEVKKVQASFATLIKKGYETDRGRVYLQYGAPNSISKQEHEPNAYPYEIWHYFSLNNQKNRKFVFYNRDLATNDYELLHSDAIGEIQNLQWQLRLHQRTFTTNDPDLQRSDWGWGSRVNDYWDNPR